MNLPTEPKCDACNEPATHIDVQINETYFSRNHGFACANHSQGPGFERISEVVERV